MANAWLLSPLSATSVQTLGTTDAGQGAYALNDYAGVTSLLRMDAPGNSCAWRIDLGADRLIDTALVFGVELVPAASSFQMLYATAAQGPFTSSFGTDATGFTYAGANPTTSGRGVSLLRRDAPVTARYVQLQYVAPGPESLARIGRIVLGRRIELERNFSFGASFGVRDLGSLDFSRRGVLLRTRGRKLRTVGLTFSNVNRDEVEAQTRPLLERLGNTEMVALVTDPAAHADRQNRCYYGPLVGDLGQTWRNPRAFEAKVNLVSIF